MIKITTIILLITGCLFQALPEEQGVLVLDDSNFDRAISKYEFIMADFYAPWCGHCNDLAPHYAQAARSVRSSTVQFAKIDCTKSQSICQRFQISGYPSLKFFANQKHVEYTGGRSTQEIVDWVKKKINIGSQPIRSLEGLRNLVLQHEVLIVYFGSISTTQDFSVFQTYARYINPILGRKNNEHIPSAYVLQPDIAEEYKIMRFPTIVLFKKYDERRVSYEGEFTMHAIEGFVERHQYPSLMTLDYKTANRIFGGTLPTLFLLFNRDTSKAEKQFRLAASTIKDKILLCMANIEDHYGSRLATYLNINDTNLPKLLIVDPSSPKDGHVQFTEELTKQNIIDFVVSYKSNEDHSDL